MYDTISCRTIVLLLLVAFVATGCASSSVVDIAPIQAATPSPSASNNIDQAEPAVPIRRQTPCVIAGCVTLAADILFESGKCTLESLSEENKTKLRDLLRRAHGISYVGFSIIGHTDSMGGRKGNHSLSICRARAIAGFFERSVPFFVSINASGRGADQPVAYNKLREGRAKNRRVEIEVLTYSFYFPHNARCAHTCTREEPARLAELRQMTRTQLSAAINPTDSRALKQEIRRSRDSDHLDRRR